MEIFRAHEEPFDVNGTDVVDGRDEGPVEVETGVVETCPVVVAVFVVTVVVVAVVVVGAVVDDVSWPGGTSIVADEVRVSSLSLPEIDGDDDGDEDIVGVRVG